MLLVLNGTQVCNANFDAGPVVVPWRGTLNSIANGSVKSKFCMMLLTVLILLIDSAAFHTQNAAALPDMPNFAVSD